jgi:alpha-amylase
MVDFSLNIKLTRLPEHLTSDYWLEPNGQFNPWYYVYQPVSYKLKSRHGTIDQLRNMIVTCRKNGVRVYADAVINHMAANGMGVDLKRDPRNCIYFGPRNATAGSPYYTHGFSFALNPWSNERPALEFPAVPFGPTDFHCERSLSDFNDPFLLNYGWLVGLSDLDTGKEYVRDRIATYLTTLLSIGFSGFRIDAAKVYPFIL